jgi:hypothetical protein
MVYLSVCYGNDMKAKFKTTCSECNAPIKSGAEISKNPSGKWVHKHCTPNSEELP